MIQSEPRSAPDHQFVDKAGRLPRLSDFWTSAEKGIVLVFLRHFGCIFCRAQIAQLRERYHEFTTRGWDLVAIGQGTEIRAARFAEDNDLPFPVFGDKERATYRAYGVPSTAFGSFLEPEAYKAGARALLRGHLPGMWEGSLNQNPGVFLIDREGRIVREHPGRHAGDFPPVDEILGWIDEETNVRR
jgi:peroxiredoxin